MSSPPSSPPAETTPAAARFPARPSLADAIRMAEEIRPCNLAFVNGRHVPAVSGETFPCINPANGKLLTHVAACDSADADLSVIAARTAFEDGRWSRQPPRQRKKILLRLAELMREHAGELALLETLDMGKPLRESRAVDVAGSAACFQWYAEWVDKLYDEIAPTGPAALGLVTREPTGVVACIVPWNFPLLMASWKLAPALAMGNSVILKPAEQSPLSALRLAALAAEAGIPDGVFQVLPGFGPTVGKALALHPDVDCLAFTGSGEVGRQLLQYSGQSNMKRVWLECGGKTPNIILADAPDLDKAARHAAMGIFYNQGEVCTAASRLIVERSIADVITGKVLALAETMQPGDPLDPASPTGALVDRPHMERVLRYIDQGQREGATLATGGHAVRTETGGCFVAPTVFTGVDNRMTIAREEIFGPVLSVITVDDPQQAIEVANDSPYGLAACLWTGNLTTAHTLSRRLKAGSIWVNCWDGGDLSTPFGGYKQSGNGRDKSHHAFDKYSELKTTWIDLQD